MKTYILAIAVALGAQFALAEEYTKTEKTVTRSENGVETQVTESTYVTRTEKAYREVGLPRETIVKLRDYDTKIVEARRAGDISRIREYYTEQRKLLRPEQVEKIRVYLRENPLPKANVVTVWEDEPVVRTREVRVGAPTTAREVRTIEERPVRTGVTTEKVETEEVEVRTEVE